MKIHNFILPVFLLITSCAAPPDESPSPQVDPLPDMEAEQHVDLSSDETPSHGGLIIVDSGDDALLGDLYLIPADGGDPEMFLDSGENGYQHFGYADWSPDGSLIAFSALKPPFEIIVVNPDGSGLHAVPNTTDGQYPDWSPDGNKIAFSTWGQKADIFIINRDGNNLINLTEDFPLNALDPSWSPGGEQIVFQATAVGEKYDLYTIAASGGSAVQLTDFPGSEWSPCWSPAGKEIAYLYTTDTDYTELNVIDQDTGNVSQWTTESVYPDLSADPGFAWSPDGQRIAFISRGTLYVSRRDGGIIFDPVWEGKRFTSYPSWK